MSKFLEIYAPFIDKELFEKLLEQAQAAEFDKAGGNSKCAILGNYAVLKSGNIPGHDNVYPQMIEALHALKEKGINVVPILGYVVTKYGAEYRGERYDTGYIVQEKAAGKELIGGADFQNKSQQQCRDMAVDYLKMINSMPQEHIDKWVSDYKTISDCKIMIDPSKNSNFFYDKEKGFSFIDLNFFTPFDAFNHVEEDGTISHSQFILYVISPIRYFLYSSYKEHFSDPKDMALCCEAVKGFYDKIVKAVAKLGVSVKEVEKAFEEFGLHLPTDESETENEIE